MTQPEHPVPSMDGAAVQRWARLAGGASPWLHDEVGNRMAQRLSWIKATPATWMDWSPVRGGAAARHIASEVYRNSDKLLPPSLSDIEFKAIKKSNESERSIWQRLMRQGPTVAGADTRVGMLWANMCLHDTHLPATMIRQWHRHLAVDGFLMFSCLGPDTLTELRAVYARLGWQAPCHAYTDMHDWGDMLVANGFDAPVMDVERMVLSYASADRLLQDLRQFGRNLSIERSHATRGRRWRQRLMAELENSLPRTADGQMTLTFEIIYGHAHKPQPSVKVADTSAISLSEMKQMLGAGRPAGKR